MTRNSQEDRQLQELATQVLSALPRLRESFDFSEYYVKRKQDGKLTPKQHDRLTDTQALPSGGGTDGCLQGEVERVVAGQPDSWRQDYPGNCVWLHWKSGREVGCSSAVTLF